MKLYRCYWGYGYIEPEFKIVGESFFTEDRGYGPKEIAKVAALVPGQTADLTDLSGTHTVVRFA